MTVNFAYDIDLRTWPKWGQDKQACQTDKSNIIYSSEVVIWKHRQTHTRPIAVHGPLKCMVASKVKNWQPLISAADTAYRSKHTEVTSFFPRPVYSKTSGHFFRNFSAQKKPIQTEVKHNLRRRGNNRLKRTVCCIFLLQATLVVQLELGLSVCVCVCMCPDNNFRTKLPLTRMFAVLYYLAWPYL